MYLAYKTYSTQPKNALDKDFEKYLTEIDRTLIDNSEITDFMLNIEEEYKNLCAVHNRCKPRQISFYGKEKHINLHGSHVSFVFLKSKD